jgi:hypothetical protein
MVASGFVFVLGDKVTKYASVLRPPGFVHPEQDPRLYRVMPIRLYWCRFKTPKRIGSVSAKYAELMGPIEDGALEICSLVQGCKSQEELRCFFDYKNWLAAATQFPGTLFFNISTLAATVINLTAAEADKHVWRPDFFGSVLFLVASAFALSALGVGFWGLQLRALPWWIAWLNMLGSVAFMASAIASFVLPSTDTLLDLPLANAGTFIGAVCFLVGAALMLPAWRASVRSSRRP